MPAIHGLGSILATGLPLTVDAQNLLFVPKLVKLRFMNVSLTAVLVALL